MPGYIYTASGDRNAFDGSSNAASYLWSSKTTLDKKIDYIAIQKNRIGMDNHIKDNGLSVRLKFRKMSTAPILLKGISSLVHHITSPTPGTTITEAGSAIRARTGTGGLEVAILQPAKPTASP